MTSPDVKNNLGTLPEWDLSQFYASIQDPAITIDLNDIKKDAVSFQHLYKGKLNTLSGDELASAISLYETIQEKIGCIGSYAYLVYAKNMADQEITQFFQNTSEQLNEIATHLIFFTLEFNHLDDAHLGKLLASSNALAHYHPWIRDIGVFKPHQLSDECEALLHEKNLTSNQSWQRLFDETLSSLVFPYKNESLSVAEIFDKLSGKDATVRKDAAKVIGKVLQDNSRIFTLVTNVLAKDKAIEDTWRKYKHPISSRNLANLIEDEVVDALICSVRDAFPKLSHRYYKLKAGWFGKDSLPYWDRNAPIPGDDDQKIAWDEAKDLVLTAYGNFSPEMARLGQEFFDKNWIDAKVTKGKESGAFSHPTVPSKHPCILMNYQGKLRDVMTLAHELGHGVHQYLAAHHGALMADTPLTLAETASVFGEQLTFRACLARESDPAKKRRMIASKVEDMLNTVVRQIAFLEFERQVHDKRKEGELSTEEIGDIWLSIQKESLGPAITFEDEYRYYWSYIPHFIHSPFYVYAYAFGDCLVNSLYANYQEHPEGFEKKYLTMLRAGGTLRHQDLLAPFGLNASDPKFWNKGLDIIASFIDQLEGV